MASTGFFVPEDFEVVWILWTLRSPNHVHTTRDERQAREGL